RAHQALRLGKRVLGAPVADRLESGNEPRVAAAAERLGDVVPDAEAELVEKLRTAPRAFIRGDPVLRAEAVSRWPRVDRIAACGRIEEQGDGSPGGGEREAGDEESELRHGSSASGGTGSVRV